MAATAPSKQAILSLYHNMLRTSQSYSSYNFREYFVRRTKDTFRAMQDEKDPERLRSMYSEAIKESTSLKRGAIVNQLYGGWKLSVEIKEEEQKIPEKIMERADS